jgi:uncharacterized HhH-GPD family protein
MPKTATKILLQWSNEDAADELVSSDPTALLIGFCLDQQITVEHAFTGPLRIVERIGTIDARKLAKVDPGIFEAAFRERPAIHRFPASMAERVQKMCAAIASDYDGDPANIWNDATDGKDLYTRLRAIPGIGEMKARTIVKLVGQYWRPDLPDWKSEAPTWPTLADVRTRDERIAYQTKKRAHKAKLRAEQAAKNAF